jgi:predicted metal-dependent enzyme (double-stranded beta helix superfamily)
MFDTDELITACRGALDESEPRRAIRDVLDRFLSRSDEIADALRPTEGGITVLHNSPEITVLHVVWAPKMQLYPHDHRMWAAIGIYRGVEDNAFYRRVGKDRGPITASGGKRVDERDVLLLGDDAIHAVTNPLDRLTAAIHVYGGDFVREPRSQWSLELSDERPYDLAQTQQEFAEANRAWRDAEAAAG